jgi:folylpolyglutamate synthase/dihydropteroate synthase
MQRLDARRLTGLNLYCADPGAVVTVRLSAEEDAEAALATLRATVARGLAQLQWTAQTHVRTSCGADGVLEAAVMITAPVDRLYAAAALLEWAVAAANGTPGDLAAVESEAAAERAARAGLLELLDHADSVGVPWLVDDDTLSLGWGRHGRTWPMAELPAPDVVPWAELTAIPVALVTGTNGKTTSSRLLARMAHEAGVCAGNSSTDGIYVDERIVDAGDWTGPGAARELLRRRELQLAILEVARGGLLRRGVEVSDCDAALITNVERDHLGEYGIHDLAAMASAKGIVTGAVRPDGCIVLGAESPALVAWARERSLPAPVQWVSPDPDHPVLRDHVAAGGVVWTVADGQLVRRDPHGDHALLAVADAPLTFEGKARHNVANLLGAAAVAQALGLPEAAIVAALRSFGRDVRDNPGRAHAWRLPDGTEILMDFAHNLAGLAAVAGLVRGLGRRPIVCFGMAGDRPDDDLRALGAALTDFGPRHLVVREQKAYMRGRAAGEVPRLLAEGATATGYAAANIHFVDSEPGALDVARGLAEPGELVVLLLHTERDAVSAWLQQAGATPTTLR